MSASGMLTVYLLKNFFLLLVGVGILVVIVPVAADYLWSINLLKRREKRGLYK